MWLCEPGHGAQTVIMNQAGYPKWDVNYVDRSAQLYMATQSVRQITIAFRVGASYSTRSVQVTDFCRSIEI